MCRPPGGEHSAIKFVDESISVSRTTAVTHAPMIIDGTSAENKDMLTERPSVCTFDCPDTCSLTVTVDEGRIVKVRGSDALPLTDGVICNKVAHHSVEFNHGASRLRYPLRRTGPRGSGQFARITWNEALDTIHARVTDVIAHFGAQAVMPLNYAGPHGMLSIDSMSLRFF